MALLGRVDSSWGQDVYSVKGPWLDEQSRTFDLETLRNSHAVITMAYGSCRRVCSTSLRVVEQLAERAKQRHIALTLVVVGLDPAHDKPSDWATLRAERGLTDGNISFLSGSEASTRQLAQRIGVKYWRYDGHVMHDFRIVLVSPQGKVVRSIDRFDDDINALLP